MARSLSKSLSHSTSTSDPYKDLLDSIRYSVSGHNSAEVKAALEDQEHVEKEINKIKSSEDYSNADTKIQIDGITNLSTMKLHCLHGMLHIANLEDSFWELHNEIDTRATNLVEQEEAKQGCKDESINPHILDYVRELSLECIHGVENNWDWILTLSKCLHTHLRNSADYHKFFHEIAESRRWMDAEFSITEENFATSDPFDLQEEKVGRMTTDIDELSMQLYHWQTKVDRLKHLAIKILPVHLRLGGVKDKLAVKSLCNYKSGPIRIRENEDVFLLDNRDGPNWKVENGRGDEGHVPALTILIPGPDQEAIAQSDALQAKLHEDGSRLIATCSQKITNYLSQVYPPDYTTEEGVKIKEMLEKIGKDVESLKDLYPEKTEHKRINDEKIKLSSDIKSVFSNGNSKKIGNLKNSLEDLYSGWFKYIHSSPKAETKTLIEHLISNSLHTPDNTVSTDRWLTQELGRMDESESEHGIRYIVGEELKPRPVEENVNKLFNPTERSSLEILDSINNEILTDDDQQFDSKLVLEQPIIKKYVHSTTNIITPVKPARLSSGSGKGIKTVSNDGGVVLRFEDEDEEIETDSEEPDYAPNCEDLNSVISVPKPPEIKADKYIIADELVVKESIDSKNVVKRPTKQEIEKIDKAQEKSSDQKQLSKSASKSVEYGGKTSNVKLDINIDRHHTVRKPDTVENKNDNKSEKDIKKEGAILNDHEKLIGEKETEAARKNIIAQIIMNKDKSKRSEKTESDVNIKQNQTPLVKENIIDDIQQEIHMKAAADLKITDNMKNEKIKIDCDKHVIKLPDIIKKANDKAYTKENIKKDEKSAELKKADQEDSRNYASEVNDNHKPCVSKPKDITNKKILVSEKLIGSSDYKLDTLQPYDYASEKNLVTHSEGLSHLDDLKSLNKEKSPSISSNKYHINSAKNIQGNEANKNIILDPKFKTDTALNLQHNANILPEHISNESQSTSIIVIEDQIIKNPDIQTDFKGPDGKNSTYNNSNFVVEHGLDELKISQTELLIDENKNISSFKIENQESKKSITRPAKTKETYIKIVVDDKTNSFVKPASELDPGVKEIKVDPKSMNNVMANNDSNAAIIENPTLNKQIKKPVKKIDKAQDNNVDDRKKMQKFENKIEPIKDEKIQILISDTNKQIKKPLNAKIHSNDAKVVKAHNQELVKYDVVENSPDLKSTENYRPITDLSNFANHYSYDLTKIPVKAQEIDTNNLTDVKTNPLNKSGSELDQQIKEIKEESNIVNPLLVDTESNNIIKNPNLNMPIIRPGKNINKEPGHIVDDSKRIVEPIINEDILTSTVDDKKQIKKPLNAKIHYNDANAIKAHNNRLKEKYIMENNDDLKSTENYKPISDFSNMLDQADHIVYQNSISLDDEHDDSKKLKPVINIADEEAANSNQEASNNKKFIHTFETYSIKSNETKFDENFTDFTASITQEMKLLQQDHLLGKEKIIKVDTKDIKDTIIVKESSIKRDTGSIDSTIKNVKEIAAEAGSSEYKEPIFREKAFIESYPEQKEVVATFNISLKKPSITSPTITDQKLVDIKNVNSTIGIDSINASQPEKSVASLNLNLKKPTLKQDSLKEEPMTIKTAQHSVNETDVNKPATDAMHSTTIIDNLSGESFLNENQNISLNFNNEEKPVVLKRPKVVSTSENSKEKQENKDEVKMRTESGGEYTTTYNIVKNISNDEIDSNQKTDKFWSSGHGEETSTTLIYGKEKGSTKPFDTNIKKQQGSTGEEGTTYTITKITTESAVDKNKQELNAQKVLDIKKVESTEFEELIRESKLPKKSVAKLVMSSSSSTTPSPKPLITIPSLVTKESNTKRESFSEETHSFQTVTTFGQAVITGHAQEMTTQNSRTEYASDSTVERVEAEQVITAKREDSQTFSVESVLDPRSQKHISLQDAVKKGILQPNEGIYFNAVAMEMIPIQEAIMRGYIKVVHTSKRTGRETTSSVGLITIKRMKESMRPYRIIFMLDTKTDKTLTAEEAAAAGIFDVDAGTFVDAYTGDKMLIAEAIDNHLVEVEYQGEAPEPEYVVKKYAVKAVVDRRNKTTLSFHDAVRRGLIDRETGWYYDNVTREKIYIGDAIKKGYLKGRYVSDETISDLEIDPTNTLVLEKQKFIKDNVVTALGVISAFKDSTKKKKVPTATLR